ncbi:ABC transporter substrate-binding protein [Nodosilinea sp. E11]|uniref:ABC transporter substrate-binding protein n=1 Tax=Nodosilinea sp. E11 TaxID=3037479 RepID=UPI0029346FC4|nr:ABC transporter substrate-binding protein [Nodosilinea sp. E11]WOD39521.1 ABC transporter substrate-binding protein [Nodosilinea sp. E11]
MMPIRSIAGSLLLAATLGLVACGGANDVATPEPTTAGETAAAPDAAELTPVKFTLSWLFQAVDAPLAIALENGYFAEAGLDVSFERGFGSADSITKIAAGQYDIGEGDMYSMIEFNEQNPNDQLVAVAIKFNRSPFAIVTKADSEFDTPADLAGANLAAPAGDGPRRLWPVLAQEVGADPDSVEWTNVEPQLRESLLAQGNADGISCFSISCLPVLHQKLGLPPEDLNVFYYNDYGLDLYGNALIVRRDFLEANPEVVQGFVTAYLRGLKEALADPEAALALVTEVADDELFDVAIESERINIALDRLYTSPEVDTMGIGGVDPVRLAATIDQVVEGFGLSSTPDVSDVFDDRALPPQDERML